MSRELNGRGVSRAAERRASGRLSIAAGLVLLAAALAGAAHAAGAPLARAIEKGETAKANRMIAAGQGINDADDRGRTPLFYASANADTPMMAALMAKGARVDMADGEGVTPLLALMRSSADIEPPAAALLAAGANVNARDHAGRTVLAEAIVRAPHVLDLAAETALVKSLLAAGADPRVKDRDGWNAAHHAAAVGAPVPMVTAVVEATGNPGLVNGEGMDVVAIAAQSDHKPLAMRLFDLGLVPALARQGSPSEDPGHAPLEARSFDWWGEWLSAKGRAEDAAHARREAVFFYRIAIAADDADIAQGEGVVAGEVRERDKHTAALVAANVIGLGLLAGTGHGFIVAPTRINGSPLKDDRKSLASVKADRAALASRLGELQAALDVGGPPAALPAAPSAPADEPKPPAQTQGVPQ
ncbi:MAG TPA: ankyrin repeat domain-containing protein [Caulobacteraceae bacterium]|jgi:hypothetical protein|nr:ankyrin repeat domain-containing protein [Caulobacteraceae bacterium]